MSIQKDKGMGCPSLKLYPTLGKPKINITMIKITEISGLSQSIIRMRL